MNLSCSSCATVYRIDPGKVPEGGVRARCTVCSHVISVSRDEEVAVTAATPVDGGGQPAVESESRAPAQSQEQVAADILGDSFIASPSPEPTAALPEPPAAPSPSPPPTPPKEPVAQPSPVTAPTPAVEPGDQPSPSVTVPMPAIEPPVEKGGLRVARPFSAPAPSQRPTGAPPEPQRPTAPTFRPTPGMPLEPAAPPARSPVAKPVINPFMSKDPKQKARRLARALVSDMIVYQPEKQQKAIEDGNMKDVFGDEVKKNWEEYVAQVGEEIANSTPFFTEALNDILAGGQSVF